LTVFERVRKQGYGLKNLALLDFSIVFSLTPLTTLLYAVRTHHWGAADVSTRYRL